MGICVVAPSNTSNPSGSAVTAVHTPFPFLCMCTQHCTANLALHTTAHAVTSDFFVEFGTNGPHWVHWAPPRRDIHLSHPFPPLSYSSIFGAPLRACASWPGFLTLDVELHHIHHHSTSPSILFYPPKYSSFHHFLSISTSPRQAPAHSASHQSLAPIITAHASQHQHSSLSMPGTPHTYSHLVMPSHAYYTSIVNFPKCTVLAHHAYLRFSEEVSLWAGRVSDVTC